MTAVFRQILGLPGYQLNSNSEHKLKLAREWHELTFTQATRKINSILKEMFENNNHLLIKEV